MPLVRPVAQKENAEKDLRFAAVTHEDQDRTAGGQSKRRTRGTGRAEADTERGCDWPIMPAICDRPSRSRQSRSRRSTARRQRLQGWPRAEAAAMQGVVIG